jgi:molybdate transport system substrate-binding protein
MKIFDGRVLIAALLFLTGPVFAADPAKPALVVFGAASLSDALEQISTEYTKTSGVHVKLSFASSSQLAKQIESGAAADVFFSADQEWMDYLDGKGLMRTETRSNLLGNRLALVAPKDSKVAFELAPNAPLAAALGRTGRLATGDPDSVPAGRYAKAALSSLSLWGTLEPRLARAENVRVALSYVARGEAPLGIVYATDAAVEPNVRLVALFPESSHTPITYPVALTRRSQPAAGGYLQFLAGKTANDIFTKAGFTILASSSATTKTCSGFAFDLSKELALMSGSKQPITAATGGDRRVAIEPGRAYQVTLADQARVRLPAPPEKVTVAEGSHAGILHLMPIESRTIRVTLDEPAWIDVVSAGKVIESTRHTGRHDCPSLRKSVEFDVVPGAPLVLQLSGSTETTVTVLVTGA